jgi:uncharacterized membrane protein YhiD involved in acid resistance
MIIDSNTFGWLLSAAIAVLILVKFWKRAIKFILIAVAALFVLLVVQIKSWYDSVILPDKVNKTEKVDIKIGDDTKAKTQKKDTVKTKSSEKQSKVMVHAKYDTLTKKIEIEDIEVLNE